jgi:hypothetical protein
MLHSASSLDNNDDDDDDDAPGPLPGDTQAEKSGTWGDLPGGGGLTSMGRASLFRAARWIRACSPALA